MRYEFLTAVTMKITVFPDVIPCSLVKDYQYTKCYSQVSM